MAQAYLVGLKGDTELLSIHPSHWTLVTVNWDPCVMVGKLLAPHIVWGITFISIVLADLLTFCTDTHNV
mgnify:CR=1 FL=1